jgi:hypothetical protein
MRASVLIVFALSMACGTSGTKQAGLISSLDGHQLCLAAPGSSANADSATCYLITGKSSVPPNLKAGDQVEVRAHIGDEGHELISARELPPPSSR